MLSRIPKSWLIAGAGCYIGGVGLAYASWYTPSISDAIDEKSRRTVFDSIAAHYDADVTTHEYLSGIEGMRKSLLGHATGAVLEIGAGTGRNSALFSPTAVSSLTLVDFSLPMLQQAERKLAAADSSSCIPTRLLVADAAALPFADASFDTTVDTFGLCSYEDPEKVLSELKRVTRSGGRILLLEHGSSSFDWLSNFLRRNECAHAHTFGCYWARDMSNIIAQAGLQPSHVERKHFGTTTLAICPVPTMQAPKP